MLLLAENPTLFCCIMTYISGTSQQSIGHSVGYDIVMQPAVMRNRVMLNVISPGNEPHGSIP